MAQAGCWWVLIAGVAAGATVVVAARLTVSPPAALIVNTATPVSENDGLVRATLAIAVPGVTESVGVVSTRGLLPAEAAAVKTGVALPDGWPTLHRWGPGRPDRWQPPAAPHVFPACRAIHHQS